jgi:hypothetical protein
MPNRNKMLAAATSILSEADFAVQDREGRAALGSKRTV